jgi:hypothetical protein
MTLRARHDDEDPGRHHFLMDHRVPGGRRQVEV